MFEEFLLQPSADGALIQCEYFIEARINYKGITLLGQ